MGGCLSGGGSSATYVDEVDGSDEDFHSRYFEDRVLGEGEFGVVKLVHDMQTSNGGGGASADHREPLACKMIRKGVVFKDNTLYAPLKPQVLRMECDILRALAGQHYCLKLCGIYESSRLVYILTEYCSGGDMLKYVVSVHGEDEDTPALRTEDASRIAFQLLDAIHHCANHHVIHRDIKPDNIMFRHPTPGAELRLIDFGSSTMDREGTTAATPEGHEKNQTMTGDELHVHTTFAGSGFYISPELFHKEYTNRTDVWSAGVVLYVLIAGYPADDLQKAFNMLQRPKRNLRKLPNLPQDLPDSLYDLLEGLLVYRHEHRKAAGDFLHHEFVQFHRHLLEEEDDMILSVEQIAAEAAGTKLAFHDSAGDNNTTNERKRLGRNASVTLSGSVIRHTIFLGYQKFERAITTLLAALLTKPELDVLLKAVDEKIDKLVVEEETIEVDKSASDAILRGKKLHIISIHQLKAIIKDLNHERALTMIDKLPDASLYEHYAYHLALLRQFAREAKQDKGGRRRASSRKSPGDADAAAEGDSSNRSTGSLKPFRSSMKNDTLERQPKQTSSVHGNNVYEGWKAGKLQNPRKPPPQRSASVPFTSIARRDPTL